MKRILLLVAVLLVGIAGEAKNKSRAFVYYYDQVNGLYDYFIKTEGDNWEEISVINNKVKFRFKTVSEQPEQTILFDKERGNYIRLTDDKCFVGSSRDDVSRKLYDGFWTNTNDGPTAVALMEKNTNIFIYEKKECRGFFTHSGKQWQEYSYSSGMLINTYSLVEESKCYVVLHCSRGGYYVKITNGGCYYSTAKDGEYSRMYGGRWSAGSLSGERSTAQSGSRKDKAFAYYKKDNDFSYHAYFMLVSGDMWDEIRVSDDKVLFHYRLVSETSATIILYDESRKVYVRLTETECFWGSSKDDINHKIYNGVWVGFDYGYSVALLMDLDINIFIFESASYSGYYTRSNDGYWLEYSAYGGRPNNTYIIIEETNTYIIMYCGSCGYYVKLTEDGCYYSTSRDGAYTKKAEGKWSQGKVQNGPVAKKNKTTTSASTATAAATGKPAVSADPLTALKIHVKDSLTKLMKLPNLTNKAIADKKIDKKNLETVGADIARQYLATLKKNALKKFNGKSIKISAYDKQKQVYTLVWNTDIFTISVPVGESESFKTNWSKMTFTEPDYYFDGSKFRLSALKLTNPVLKKTYIYDIRNQKRAAPSIKINDLDVALPSN